MTRDPLTDFMMWIDSKAGDNLTVGVLLILAFAAAAVGLLLGLIALLAVLL